MDITENKMELAEEVLQQENICSKCGQTLEPEDLFCSSCGAAVATSSLQDEEKVSVPMQKKNKKVLPIVLIAIGTVVLIVTALFLGVPFVKYCQTINMMENGQYVEAITAFENMDGYLKSEEYLTECRYLHAQNTLKQGVYANAAEMFTSLGEYKNSREMVSECYYNIALQEKTAENYLEAAEIFANLGEYKDSASQIVECEYLYACEVQAMKDYQSALELFEALQGYKDSAEKALQSKYLYACQLLSADDYHSALELFEALQPYEDSAEKVLECKYQLALQMIAEGKIVDAHDQLVALGEYKDCKEVLDSIDKIYQMIMSKPKIFVNTTRSEASGVRIWLSTKVIDDNTLEIIVSGSNGAADSMKDELIGIWDETTGRVYFRGCSYRTLMGRTYCEDDNVTGYLYCWRGYIYLVYDEKDLGYTPRFS